MDPRKYRLSKHFVLSDFLGCHSVYAKGYPNPFVMDDTAEEKLENATALCVEALEPVLQEFGPLSVGYGYISPDLSRRIVKYQDPEKPSHHRFDLGAAADICVHNWVCGDSKAVGDLFLPESARGSPIALAHGFEFFEIPYSRLITYSESPYVCVAVSAREVVSNRPRKAFYENRYAGKPKAKPTYLQYATPVAKLRALEDLQTNGLAFPWKGGGFPSYHGGGFRQFHHTRVSKYTMLSDWLFDLKSVSDGARNVPSMQLDSVQDAFAAAGIVYDWMVDQSDAKRLSIVSGYVSHTNPNFKRDNDWRTGTITFAVNYPEDDEDKNRAMWLNLFAPPGAQFTYEDGFVLAVVDVEAVLTEKGWE